MEPFTLNQSEIMLISEWQNLDSYLVAGFTTKNGGVSTAPYQSFNLGLHVNDNKEHVIENRKKLGNLTGFQTTQFICSDQVHDAKVIKVTSLDGGKGVLDYESAIPSTDGIYTDEPNLLLTSCYADCVPLYFYVPRSKIVGLAHAGWKGTVKQIASNMIQNIVENERVRLDEILVTIGPSIRDCCYIVDDFVINEVKNVLSTEDSSVYSEVSTGQYRLNLAILNKLILIRAGVKSENISFSSYCTSCEEDKFFSHRRDKGITGRMMSFIGYRED
ncbi:peptidoglycan editing factor PgeF [Bacillus suaedaesalsae]|uniref:Purine nucleoside phosphorylase n=1 Tax=Bacillus suaedaesalsae TaxID=2810349 RepID=A0ABS2DJ63_9BACI|nr:peptidoglycan editing factor PgeF [Bacillus suaedaesalsae]MBM6618534.1 peptidoglycan editing factor PgeF [Bacillus suaedaesalsae]